MRAAARDAGRHRVALEYTRWGSTGLTAGDVEDYAATGVTRLVLGAGSLDLGEQRAEISAFGKRHGLG
jgi:hypothetical protein